MSEHCDDCVKREVVDLIKVVYELIGKVKGTRTLQVAVIVLGILFTGFAYLGKSALAGDVKVNTSSIESIQSSIAEQTEALDAIKKKLGIEQ